MATGSAAEKAGIKPGDVIVGIDDTAINTPAALQEKVNSYRPGDTITVKVNRGGETLNLQGTFIEETEAPITKS